MSGLTKTRSKWFSSLFLLILGLILSQVVGLAGGAPNMGADPFGGPGNRLPSAAVSAESIHAERLDKVRRIVEDVAANDWISQTKEEAEAIRAADLKRRAIREMLIRSMPGMGDYLVELAREKIEQRSNSITLYLLAMTERRDIEVTDVQDLIREAVQVLSACAVRLSAFEAALLSGMLDLLKAHPADGGKEFLLQVIESRTEVGLKLKAADCLAATGDPGVLPFIQEVLAQADARSDDASYGQIRQSLRDRMAVLTGAAATGSAGSLHFSWLMLALAAAVCVGLVARKWHGARRP